MRLLVTQNLCLRDHHTRPVGNGDSIFCTHTTHFTFTLPTLQGSGLCHSKLTQVLSKFSPSLKYFVLISLLQIGVSSNRLTVFSSIQKNSTYLIKRIQSVIPKKERRDEHTHSCTCSFPTSRRRPPCTARIDRSAIGSARGGPGAQRGFSWPRSSSSESASGEPPESTPPAISTSKRSP